MLEASFYKNFAKISHFLQKKLLFANLANPKISVSPMSAVDNSKNLTGNLEVLSAVFRDSDEGPHLIHVHVGVVQLDPEALLFAALAHRDAFRVLMRNFRHS